MELNTSVNKHRALWFPVLVLLTCGLIAATTGPLSPVPVIGVATPITLSQISSSGLAGDVYDIPDGLRNMEAQYAQTVMTSSFAPTWDQTSHFMIGKVAVGLILPESTGNSYNWTQNEINAIEAKTQASLDWWEMQAATYDIPLELVLDGPHIISTIHEPIQMVMGPPDSTWCGEEDQWIGEVMANMGFNQFPNYVMNVRDYANALRDTHDADWAFVIFVANADGPNAEPPTDKGFFAEAEQSASCPNVPPRLIGIAYRPGPMYITNDNPNDFTSNELDKIMRHEQGHVFGASDESHSAWPDCFSTSACSEQHGYLSIENDNCDYSCATNLPCVMRAGVDALCVHSRSQLGWRDSDSDGTADPIDTLPDVVVSGFPNNPAIDYTLQYDAVAQDVPLSTSHPAFTDVTINDVRVEYQLVNHTQGYTTGWMTAKPGDGAWDNSYEEDFSILVCQNGNYTIRIRAINEVDNISTTMVEHPLTVILSQPCETSYLPIIVGSSSQQLALPQAQGFAPDAYPAPVPALPEMLTQPPESYP